MGFENALPLQYPCALLSAFCYSKTPCCWCYLVSHPEMTHVRLLPVVRNWDLLDVSTPGPASPNFVNCFALLSNISNAACLLLLQKARMIFFLEECNTPTNVLTKSNSSYTFEKREFFIHTASAYCMVDIFLGWRKCIILVITFAMISSVS